MKLEQQVVSLELAKKLKELGVKQETLWYWQRFQSKGKKKWALSNTTNSHCVSAFTVAELGEMLPISITRKDKQKFSPAFYKNRGDFADEVRWSVEYSSYTLDNSEIEVQRVGDTEADARAKMLIYLLENKLITR